MIIARFAVTGILAALLVYSAAMKVSGKAEVIESYARVGVDRRRLPLLATVLMAGAGGLLIGLWWPLLGTTTAAALVVYFALALAAHARHDDMSHAVPPAVLLILAAIDAALFAFGG